MKSEMKDRNSLVYRGQDYSCEIIVVLLKIAFEKGIAKLIENDLNLGIMGVGCKIGKGAFYFLSSEDEELSIEQIKENYTNEMLYEQIAQTIIDLDEEESSYYMSILMRGHLKLYVSYNDNSVREFIIPWDWFEKSFISEEESLDNFLSMYTSEESSEIFGRAVLEQKLEGEVYYG